MTKKTCWTVVALLALAGCSAQEQDQPAADVATPSEGARITNQNPSSPTVDVPKTPANEAAAPATDGGADLPKTPPDEPAPTTPDADAKAPAVIEKPSEPTPDVKDGTAAGKDEGGAPKSR